MNSSLNLTRYLFILLNGILICQSCQSNQKLNWGDYQSWIASQESGLNKTLQIEGFNFNLQFIPAAYSAINDMHNTGIAKSAFDSLKMNYKNSFMFLVKVSREDQSSPLKTGVSNRLEYEYRLDQLSYKMMDYLLLQADDKLVRPILAETQELEFGSTLSILVAFPTDEIKNSLVMQDQIDFVFVDPVWGLDDQRFTFDSQDLIADPLIALN